MPCRMEGNFYSVDIDDFTVFHTLTNNIRTDALMQDRFGKMMAEVFFHSPTGMVGVTMSDNGKVYRSPWINIELASRTVNAFIGKSDQFQGMVDFTIMLQKPNQSLMPTENAGFIP